MFGFFKKHDVACETHNPVTERTWQSILNKADANDESYREAVAALNVKVICELAPWLRDKSKYESFGRKAVDLALSIRDERFRDFAMKQIEGLSRTTAELCSGIERDGAITQLVTRARVNGNVRGLMERNGKTPLISLHQPSRS
jgi:hypothetical protein